VTARQPPVCSWTVPDDTVHEKPVDELREVRPQVIASSEVGAGRPAFVALVGSIALLVAWCSVAQ